MNQRILTTVLSVAFTTVFMGSCATNPNSIVTPSTISPTPTAINNNGSAGYPWGDNSDTKITDPIGKGTSVPSDIKNNGSIGNPWGNDTNGTTYNNIVVRSTGGNPSEYTNTGFGSHTGSQSSNFGANNGGTFNNNYPTVTSGGMWDSKIEEKIDSKRWRFGLGLGSGSKYNYALTDSENNKNQVNVSTTKVGKNVFIEVNSNLIAKEYVLSYVKDEDNLIIKDKQDSPYFILTNLAKGTYKVWLEIGKNLVNLESIDIK